MSDARADSQALNAASRWLGPAVRQLPGAALPGSPERCVRRWAVVHGSTGQAFALERLHQGQHAPREAIARNLARLDERGMPALLPYLPVPGSAGASHALPHELKTHVLETQGACWMLAPLFPGEPLPRPEFIEDPARGESLAELLLALREAAGGTELEDARPGLDLTAYAASLFMTLKRREPGVAARLAAPLRNLAGAMDELEGWPRAFCHGDFHPLNVLWREERAAALIDWEFCGIRPALYDAANLVGCVGMENPDGLARGLVPAFLARLGRGGFLHVEDWDRLAALVPLVRLAWLSEWLRGDDREMIDLELDYIELLAAHRDRLAGIWARAAASPRP
ncbi:MAG: phosphotransferase family protein [Desulfovibrionaceae bacterium]